MTWCGTKELCTVIYSHASMPRGQAKASLTRHPSIKCVHLPPPPWLLGSAVQGSMKHDTMSGRQMGQRPRRAKHTVTETDATPAGQESAPHRPLPAEFHSSTPILDEIGRGNRAANGGPGVEQVCGSVLLADSEALQQQSKHAKWMLDGTGCPDSNHLALRCP